MSKLLGGSTILLKQQYDVVASRNSDVVVVVKEEGSARRCGGQGDVLAGSLGVAIHWANVQAKRLQTVRFEWMTLTPINSDHCLYLAFPPRRLVQGS